MKVNRAATIRRDDTPAEEKPFRIAMASGTPCDDEVWDAQRCEYCRAPVVLKMDADSIDLRWIEHGVPVLIGHPHRGQCREAFLVARAESPYISDDGKLCSDKLVWSDSEKAQSVRSDVEKGVITDLSIECDYNPDDTETERGEDGRITRLLVTRWRPLAVAFVVNGADPASGVNRSINQAPVREARKTPIPNAAQAAEGKNMDKETMKEAIELARRYCMPPETVNKWIDADATIADIRRDVLDHTAKKNPPIQRRVTDSVIVSEMEKSTRRSYSLSRAILALAGGAGAPDAGFELEVSQELARAYGRTPKGLYVALRREDDAPASGGDPGASEDPPVVMDTTAGAALVHTEHRYQDYVDLLRSKMVLAELGANVLDGLVGTVNIPVCTGDVTGYWVAENGDVDASKLDHGSITLIPKTCGSLVDITRAMLISGLPQVDSIVMNAITAKLARTIQVAAISGTGSNNQPAGIFSKFASAPAAASPSFAAMLALQGTLEDANVDAANAKYLLKGSLFAGLRSIPRNEEGGDTMTATMEAGRKYIADVPAATTSDCPAKKILVGDFANGLWIGLHSPLDINVDTSTKSASGGIRIVGLQSVSVGVLIDRFAQFVCS